MKMKTAKELMKISMKRDDWKHLKLWTWANDYEAKMNDWNNILPPVSDDRRLYINTYQQVYEAIDSLSDNPPAWVCVAITRELAKEREMMDEILERFR